MREVDRLCTARFGIPSILLMENAAIGVASVALDLVERHSNPRVLIVCGPGNNGGDGYAVARHLHNEGIRVAIVAAAGPKGTGDAAVNFDIARKIGLPMFVVRKGNPAQTFRSAISRLGRPGPSLVIDALLGTGVDRALAGTMAEIVGHTNRLRRTRCTVLAVDIPSGLDADTGLPAGGGAAVRADITVTLCGLKAGFLCPGASEYVGDLSVVGIGAPPALLRAYGRRLRLTGAEPAER